MNYPYETRGQRQFEERKRHHRDRRKEKANHKYPLSREELDERIQKVLDQYFGHDIGGEG